jgi:nicotinamide-nucleotide amidase
MIDRATMEQAEGLIARLRAGRVTVGTAESLTGGLIAAALTNVPGASEVVDRGLVVYSWEAKQSLLGVPRALLELEGAVSEAVARAMVEGLIARSEGRVELAVAVTGVAGPGPSEGKPAGRVHLAVARRSTGRVVHAMRDYGESGRGAVRLATVGEALTMLHAALTGG